MPKKTRKQSKQSSRKKTAGGAKSRRKKSNSNGETNEAPSESGLPSSLGADVTLGPVQETSRSFAAGQAGDLQGISDVEDADSESVEELLEDGQAFEAEIVEGVEDAQSEKPVPSKGRLDPDVGPLPAYADRNKI